MYTKVLGAGSMLIGIRKLWRIFPIKQKFNTCLGSFLRYSIISNYQNQFGEIASIVHSVAKLHNGRRESRNYAQFCLAQKFFGVKKAAELLNFSLIGKTLHNSPMAISIEPATKSFMYSNIAMAQSEQEEILKKISTPELLRLVCLSHHYHWRKSDI